MARPRSFLSTKILQLKPTSSAIADKYVTYEVKDGAYKFTEITSSDSGLDEYSAAQVNSYKDGRIYANASGSGDEYLIDDDAVVYVKYNADKYAILSRQRCCWLG